MINNWCIYLCDFPIKCKTEDEGIEILRKLLNSVTHTE
jgi:hypothetical protein